MHRKELGISTLLILCSLCCEGETTLQGGVESLESSRPVVTMESGGPNEWAGDLWGLDIDPTTQHLLAADGANQRVVEFNIQGEALRTYGGRQGSGPGENERASRFSWTDSTVIIVDARNAKALLFARHGESEGSLIAEFPLERRYSGILPWSGGRLIGIPGSDGAALDIYGPQGTLIESRGDVANLPPACIDGDCERLSPCVTCLVAVSGDTAIVIAEQTSPAVSVLDTAGTVLREFAFQGPPVDAWKRESEQRIRENESIRPSNAIEIKNFVHHLSLTPDEYIVLSVLPSQSVLDEHGRELWIIDMESGERERYRYPTSNAGQYATVFESRIFAIAARSGDVLEYSFPARGPGGE